VDRLRAVAPVRDAHVGAEVAIGQVGIAQVKDRGAPLPAVGLDHGAGRLEAAVAERAPALGVVLQLEAIRTLIEELNANPAA
jgi:hypothetical protein